MSSNLLRFGFTSSKCLDGEPSNKRKKNGEGTIQAGESSAQSEGSDKGRDLEGPDLGHTKRLVDVFNLF